jgi:uncharacterized protein (TIGR03435 family)
VTASIFARKRLRLLATAIFSLCIGAHAQTALSYDVVSIKPNNSGSGSTRVSVTAEVFAGTNVSLKTLIAYAYGFDSEDLIYGLPAWASSLHFDVQGKVDATTLAQINSLPKDEAFAARRAMMQETLADRFRLKVHHETREQQIYLLVLAKGGSKMKEADPHDKYLNGTKGRDGTPRGNSLDVTNRELTAQGIPTRQLAAELSRRLHRSVSDSTGLTGNYDFSFQYPKDLTGGLDAADNAGPSIFTILQEQLGLKLEASKGPVDTIVIDHIEMPSEN